MFLRETGLVALRLKELYSILILPYECFYDRNRADPEVVKIKALGPPKPASRKRKYPKEVKEDPTYKPMRESIDLLDLLPQSHVEIIQEAGIKYSIQMLHQRHMDHCGWGLLMWKLDWELANQLRTRSTQRPSIKWQRLWHTIRDDTPATPLTAMQTWLYKIGVTARPPSEYLLATKPPESYEERVDLAISKAQQFLREQYPNETQYQRAERARQYIFDCFDAMDENAAESVPEQFPLH